MTRATLHTKLKELKFLWKTKRMFRFYWNCFKSDSFTSLGGFEKLSIFFWFCLTLSVPEKLKTNNSIKKGIVIIHIDKFFRINCLQKILIQIVWFWKISTNLYWYIKHICFLYEKNTHEEIIYLLGINPEKSSRLRNIYRHEKQNQY